MNGGRGHSRHAGVLGYCVLGPDNDLHMLGWDAPHPVCPRCGIAVDKEWVDPGFKLAKTRYDLSYTMDGYVIVSERFRGFAHGRGARFIPLPSSGGFYSLRVDEVVPFDTKRRRTRFEDRCDECSRFQTVVGATPVFLVNDTPLPDRFVRTDVEFGSGDEWHPLILVGSGLRDDLHAARLSGLEFLPVEGKGANRADR